MQYAFFFNLQQRTHKCLFVKLSQRKTFKLQENVAQYCVPPPTHSCKFRMQYLTY